MKIPEKEIGRNDYFCLKQVVENNKVISEEITFSKDYSTILIDCVKHTIKGVWKNSLAYGGVSEARVEKGEITKYAYIFQDAKNLENYMTIFGGENIYPVWKPIYNNYS